MPAMPRVKGIATKIAFSVLGKPSNIYDKKTSIMKKIDKKLLFENTQRVR